MEKEVDEIIDKMNFVLKMHDENSMSLILFNTIKTEIQRDCINIYRKYENIYSYKDIQNVKNILSNNFKNMCNKIINSDKKMVTGSLYEVYNLK